MYYTRISVRDCSKHRQLFSRYETEMGPIRTTIVRLFLSTKFSKPYRIKRYGYRVRTIVIKNTFQRERTGKKKTETKPSDANKRVCCENEKRVKDASCT